MLSVSAKRKESIGWEELNDYGRCGISWLMRNKRMAVDTNCAYLKTGQCSDSNILQNLVTEEMTVSLSVCVE